MKPQTGLAAHTSYAPTMQCKLISAWCFSARQRIGKLVIIALFLRLFSLWDDRHDWPFPLRDRAYVSLNPNRRWKR